MVMKGEDAMTDDRRIVGRVLREDYSTVVEQEQSLKQALQDLEDAYVREVEVAEEKFRLDKEALITKIREANGRLRSLDSLMGMYPTY